MPLITFGSQQILRICTNVCSGNREFAAICLQ